MPLEASYPAVPGSVGEIRSRVVEFARSCRVDRATLDDVALAVSEAATNVVLHAYRGAQGTIDIVADGTADDFRVSIVDRGVGMTPRLDSPGLGLGLAIIAGICARFDVERSASGTELRMMFSSRSGAT